MSIVEKFPYCDRGPGSAALDAMPDLPIALAHKSFALSCVGLVDSGAKVSVLPYSLGIRLGLDWTSQTAGIPLGGAFARIRAWGVVLRAKVGELSPVDLAFAWAESDHIPLLLGQFNFFEEFDVCFFRARRVFELRGKS